MDENTLNDILARLIALEEAVANLTLDDSDDFEIEEDFEDDSEDLDEDFEEESDDQE